MKKLLLLILIGCGPKLQPIEIINYSARSYQDMTDYQDSFIIMYTKNEKGIEVNYLIKGKTYFKSPDLFLIDIDSPERIKIGSNGDSIIYYLIDHNNYYKSQMPRELHFDDLQLSNFLKYKVKFTTLRFLLEKPLEIINEELDVTTLRYLGTSWKNGRLVYKITTEIIDENIKQEWTLDCKEGAIIDVKTTLNGTSPHRFKIEEKYYPIINSNLDSSLFRIDIPISAIRI